MSKFKLLALLLLLPALAFGGTVTGVVQTATSGPVINGVLTFTLTQSAVQAGTATIVTSPVSCYTDSSGNVVGEPNPLVAPIVTPNTASGTLAAGTYFTVIAYADASGTTFYSPETTTILSAQGSLIVSAPVRQPAGATSYKVFISSTTGTETLQSTVTVSPGSWPSFTQSASLSAGSALPASNSTACKILFNDQLTPSFTGYNVGMTNQNGSALSGFPQKWYLSGGASGTVNLSSGTPLYSGVVTYPQAIVTTPAAQGRQSVNGALDYGVAGQTSTNAGNQAVTGNSTVGGTLGAKAINSTDTVTGISACIENGMYVAGSSCYATIAAARTAAGSNTVLIPSTYAGADTVADGTNPVIDLRNNVFKASHFFGCAYPMTNAPGGLDCSYEANGAGDLVFKHNTHVNPSTTTAVTLNVGANTNFLVGNTALFGTGGTAPIIVGRDTANEETVGTGNWSIVDGTHLSVTCIKSHGPGTTDIEQLGVTQIDPGIFIQLNAHKPAQFSGALFPPTRWNDPNGTTFMVTPGQSGATFPFGQILIASNTSISGFTAGAGSSYLNPADLNFRNASASNNINFNNSSGTLIFRISDTQFLFSQPIFDSTAGAAVAASGAIRFQNAHGFAWRNVGNTADLSLGVNAADGLAFNTAAVVGTIPYNVGVANLTAQSAAVGPTTIRAVGAGQAGMFLVCWSAVVTQAATTSSTLGGANVGFQVTYTDNDTGAAATTPLAAAPAAGTNTAYSQTNSQNTVGAQASGCLPVNAKASTNIQYNFGYTSVGATVMQYALHVRIDPI